MVVGKEIVGAVLLVLGVRKGDTGELGELKEDEEEPVDLERRRGKLVSLRLRVLLANHLDNGNLETAW